MSLPECRTTPHLGLFRSIVLSGCVAALMLASACTVRPLYMASPVASDGTQTGMAAQLASVVIKPVTNRYGQEVRNQLQFLFYGGAAAPASARYSMDLSVVSLNESAATIQISTTENEPTAATVTLVGTYRLTDATSAETVASGTRRIMSSYDVPKQEFAALRAQRDAQNRAARELAQLLNLAVAQDLTKAAAQ